jgi:WD40 repeat protein
VAFPFGRIEDLHLDAGGAVLLAAGGRPGREGGALLIDVATGAERARFAGGGDSLLAARVSTASDRIALGGARKRVEVFTLSGARVFETPLDDWCLALDVTTDGAHLAAADRSGAVRIVDFARGTEEQVFRGHDGAVHAVAFRPDGDVVATAGADGTVRCFDLRSGKQAWSKAAHEGGALALVWLDVGRLASSGADGTVRLWRADGGEIRRFDKLGDWVDALAALGGDRLVAGDARGELHWLPGPSAAK